MDEYLIRIKAGPQANMEVVIHVLMVVLADSGTKIVQWGKKEEMLDILTAAIVKRTIVVDGRQIQPPEEK